MQNHTEIKVNRNMIQVIIPIARGYLFLWELEVDHFYKFEDCLSERAVLIDTFSKQPRLKKIKRTFFPNNGKDFGWYHY